MKNVLLVGDSICLDYRKYLFPALEAKMNIFGKGGVEEAYKNLDEAIGGNGGDSSKVLEYVTNLSKGNKLNYDYFVFNCGLHDLKCDKVTHKYQISIDNYKQNLYSIINIIKKNNIKVIFINTTPIVHSRYPENFPYTRFDEDVDIYNNAAQCVMDSCEVIVIDLNSFVKQSGKLDDTMYRDHAHYQPDRIKQQAVFLEAKLTELIK